MTEKSPCIDCKPPKRQPGCQDTCPDGKAWNEKDKAKREAIKEVKRKQNDLYAYKRDRIEETIKRATSGGRKRHK